MPKKNFDIESGGDGHQAIEEEQIIPLLKGADLRNVYSQTSNYGTIRYFVDAGDDLRQLLFRLDFPDDRFVVAATQCIADAIENHNTLALEQLKNRLIGMASIQAKRMQMTLEAVIGEHLANNLLHRNSWQKTQDWMKRNAGFGSKNKQIEEE